MKTDMPGLTPLDSLDLPEPLVALCRARQIVTAEQAHDLVEALLREAHLRDGDAGELNTWLERLDRCIDSAARPPADWTPPPHPTGGVLPPEQGQTGDLEGLQPLVDEPSEDS